MANQLLLLDESSLIQRVVQLTFEDQDISVHIAHGAAEGLDFVRSERPSIVVASADIEGGGLEFCRRIKADSDLASIPVLVLLDSPGGPEESEAIAAGAAGVLVKPFEPTALLEEVGRALGAAAGLPEAPPAEGEESEPDDMFAAMANGEEPVENPAEGLEEEDLLREAEDLLEYSMEDSPGEAEEEPAAAGAPPAPEEALAGETAMEDPAKGGEPTDDLFQEENIEELFSPDLKLEDLQGGGEPDFASEAKSDAISDEIDALEAELAALDEDEGGNLAAAESELDALQPELGEEEAGAAGAEPTAGAEPVAAPEAGGDASTEAKLSALDAEIAALQEDLADLQSGFAEEVQSGRAEEITSEAQEDAAGEEDGIDLASLGAEAEEQLAAAESELDALQAELDEDEPAAEAEPAIEAEPAAEAAPAGAPALEGDEEDGIDLASLGTEAEEQLAAAESELDALQAELDEDEPAAEAEPALEAEPAAEAAPTGAPALEGDEEDGIDLAEFEAEAEEQLAAAESELDALQADLEEGEAAGAEAVTEVEPVADAEMLIDEEGEAAAELEDAAAGDITEVEAVPVPDDPGADEKLEAELAAPFAGADEIPEAPATQIDEEALRGLLEKTIERTVEGVVPSMLRHMETVIVKMLPDLVEKVVLREIEKIKRGE
ncbi:MAG: response regulator [bacterium]